MDTIKTSPPTFMDIPEIGVIWVLDEASKLGYYDGNPDWANLGQGEPEVGIIEGAPDRIYQFNIEPGDDRYGPLNGLAPLRTAIAHHYNRLYRKDKASQYTADNVSLAMGGRLALTRVFSIIDGVRLGFRVPEYPAYEDMIGVQKRIIPVCIPTNKEHNFTIPAEEFEKAIQDYKLNAFIMSNPCNPTGHVVKGNDLATYVKAAKNENCSLITDEVYSHFIYENGKPAKEPVSAAAFVEDVNKDQVLIIDALTKSFRYPGWRLAWILGPKDVIQDLGRAASGIDGGPSLPIQRAAIQLFEPWRADQETQALRTVFAKKQTIILNYLKEMGIEYAEDACSTFYIWGDLSNLPAPLNDSNVFFKEALKHQVITVPGHLFDIHPGQRDCNHGFNQYIRFSFGPNEDNLIKGLERIAQLIKSYK